jgi:8-oxo-dGTP diphosphatase
MDRGASTRGHEADVRVSKRINQIYRTVDSPPHLMAIMKPRQRLVALIIKNAKGELLIVKRPGDEEGPLAGVWGFPAVMLKENESEVEAAHRLGPTNLGIDVEVGRKIGERTGERETFILGLSDYEAIIHDGQMPSVPQNDTTVTICWSKVHLRSERTLSGRSTGISMFSGVSELYRC